MPLATDGSGQSQGLKQIGRLIAAPRPALKDGRLPDG